jgi:16S rRNA (cytidine1402-2'-O)-methyltransferase
LWNRLLGTLYLVGTPIGNLEDISLRALRTLREARLIAAEDTRRTRHLLAHYDIHTPLTSYYEHNKLSKLDTILDALANGDVALVSEAGMPGLSDPGYELVKAAIEAGHRVVPVPGPSALVAALVVSGLPTDACLYLGFLPRRAAERRRLLAEVAAERRTLVAFEAPHRLLEALSDVQAVLGERQVAVARELTKLHEEIWRGPVGEALAHYLAEPPRGEITLVIAGATDSGQAAVQWDADRVRSAVAALLEEGVKRNEAIRRVAEASGWPRRDVYRLAVR